MFLILFVVLAVKVKDERLLFHFGLQMDWPPPELVDVFEDLSCVFHIQLYPLEAVAKVELAVAILVPIDNLDMGTKLVRLATI